MDNYIGYEHSFYGGLHYDEYSWKKKNLYLDGLFFLTGGLCTRFRIGSIPRFMFNFLIHPRVIDFNEKHAFAIKILIAIKEFIFRIRSKVVQSLKLIIRDPYAIYNLGFYIKHKFSGKAKPSALMD